MNRIFHPWDKWECYRAGFYNERCLDGKSTEEAEHVYRGLLSDIRLFEKALFNVINDWVYSCEHYLTNEGMNRVAWLGQASLAYKYNIPSKFRKGYFLLDDKQKVNADKTALKYLNIWLKLRGDEAVGIQQAKVTSLSLQDKKEV